MPQNFNNTQISHWLITSLHNTLCSSILGRLYLAAISEAKKGSFSPDNIWWNNFLPSTDNKITCSEQQYRENVSTTTLLINPNGIINIVWIKPLKKWRDTSDKKAHCYWWKNWQKTFQAQFTVTNNWTCNNDNNTNSIQSQAFEMTKACSLWKTHKYTQSRKPITLIWIRHNSYWQKKNSKNDIISKKRAKTRID